MDYSGAFRSNFLYVSFLFSVSILANPLVARILPKKQTCRLFVVVVVVVVIIVSLSTSVLKNLLLKTLVKSVGGASSHSLDKLLPSAYLVEGLRLYDLSPLVKWGSLLWKRRCSFPA